MWLSPLGHVQAKEWADESLREETGQLSSCAAGYVAVKPRKGDAILWHNVRSDGTLETDSLHFGYNPPSSVIHHDSNVCVTSSSYVTCSISSAYGSGDASPYIPSRWCLVIGEMACLESASRRT